MHSMTRFEDTRDVYVGVSLVGLSIRKLGLPNGFRIEISLAVLASKMIVFEIWKPVVVPTVVD